VHTTNSKHHFRRYPNLAKDFTPLKAHELWVADITYIPLKHRFAYLYLITDAYSRKIVGFHVSDDMKVTSALQALKRHWLKSQLKQLLSITAIEVFNTAVSAYVELLQQHHAHISMTQNGDPYENAIAERINGILKSELIRSCYDNVDDANSHISRCITIYNYRRRHASLNWQIPDDVHRQQGPQIRRWKNYYRKQNLMNQNTLKELTHKKYFL
jgi:transposase InsO family protein